MVNLSVLSQLREIGSQLDADVYPHLFNDGVVAPAGSVIGIQPAGVENENESRSTCRSPTWSWRRSAGWRGQTGQSRPPNPAASPGCEPLQANYCKQLDAVFAAYPQTNYLLQDNGLWLCVESAVLPGLNRRATFLIAIPFFQGSKVRAWGYWSTAIGIQWIGPRHTNAVDGSICAFTPQDGTWNEGGDLRNLIDLYTLWAFCHLHNEVIGWWPGRQTAVFAYERLTECNDNEWCGCRSDAPRYGECCKKKDLEADRTEIAIKFVGEFLQYQPRRPPAAITSVLMTGMLPPPMRLQRSLGSLYGTSSLCPANRCV